MTSYGLMPDTISENSPIGTSFGAPNYSIVNNNGMDTRPLNQFDKTFQSTLQNERDNQLGTAFVGGKGGRRRRTRIRGRRVNKRHHTKKSTSKNHLRRAKNRRHHHVHHSNKRTYKKNQTHTHSSYNQSHLSRKRKGGPKSMLRRLFFGRGEPIGYTMDTKNTDSLHGALATPYNSTGYE